MATSQNDTTVNSKKDAQQADSKAKKKTNNSIKISIEDMYE